MYALLKDEKKVYLKYLYPKQVVLITSTDSVKFQSETLLRSSILYKFTVKCNRHKVWAVLRSCPHVTDHIPASPTEKKGYKCPFEQTLMNTYFPLYQPKSIIKILVFYCKQVSRYILLIYLLVPLYLQLYIIVTRNNKEKRLLLVYFTLY